MFSLIHVIAVLNRPEKKWNKIDLLVFVWALGYVFLVPVLMKLSGLITKGSSGPEFVFGISELIVFIGLPGLTSAVILRFAWNSNRVFFSVLIGTVCAIATGFLGILGVVIISPILWNLAYIFGCIREISKAHSLKIIGQGV